MVPPPDVLKVELRVEINDQPLVIHVQVQGEGESARRAAAELSAALTNTLAALAKSAGSPYKTVPAGPVQPAPTAAAEPSSLAAAPAPEAVQLASVSEEASAGQPSAQSSLDLTVAAPRPEAIEQPSLAALMQRYRSRINLGFGGLLVALAVLVPIIVPADQRREVLIITILFGLTGALLLFTAMLPGLGRQAAGAGAAPEQKPPPEPLRAEPLRAEPSRPAPPVSSALRRRALTRQRTPMKAGWGIALGVGFVLLGLLAPFTLGATTADERFILMLGFAPITVVGFFLIAIFGRSIFARWQPTHEAPRPSPAAQPAPRRAPASRVPQTFEYRAIVPAAILGLLVVMIAVVIVVVYATIASAVR
jgi:hypothetical protein